MRRLHLGLFNVRTEEGLSEMVKKLPLLEELHLECTCISKKTIEVVGRCCLHLKSFELYNPFHRRKHFECDMDALAIAENMPGLRHLMLFGILKITSYGLLAILENCPHLESLDMLVNVANLGPDLVKRLSQQVKDRRLSNDSTEDNISDDEIYDSDDSSALSDINSVSDDSDYYDEDYIEFSGGSDIDSD